MAVTREEVDRILSTIPLPGGGDLVSRDMVRALVIDGGTIRFVIEAASVTEARNLGPVQKSAEAALRALPGVTAVQIATTAHEATAHEASSPPAANAPSAPQLRIGGHATAHQGGPQRISGIKRVIAVASGKGGVGKSTVASNLAVALARQGRRVGLLDADIHGPSQARMMGVNERPSSPDGKIIEPLHAHGVTLMSMGVLLKENEAVIWRGPMLAGALQQLTGQVRWGELDVLVIDLPPGTGDVQLSLAQRTHLTGAIVVCTPQDVALLDARKAIDMFNKLKTPILGLIENMSTFICPNCGHESHIFGHGGVAEEARRIEVPFLGELPLALEVRIAGDAGTPVAAGAGPHAEAYARIAHRLIEGGIA